MKKEAINFKESTEGYMGQFVRRKWKIERKFKSQMISKILEVIFSLTEKKKKLLSQCTPFHEALFFFLLPHTK